MRFRTVVWAVAFVAAGGAAPVAASLANPHNLGPCTGCHRETPRFGVDSRRSVSFITSADDPGLCLPCHPAGQLLHPVGVALAAATAGGSAAAYLPAGVSGAGAGKVVCTTCHFIHASDGRYSLLRGFPGTPDPRHYASRQEFCADCHGGTLAGRSAHGGGERSCVFCHAAKPTPQVVADVIGRSRDVCLLCHASLKETHYQGVNPFPHGKDCLDCHDPHAAAGDRPGLLNDAFLAAAAESVEVRPHFRKGFCFACHANTDDYSLRVEDINELCDRCHASGRIAANIHPLRAVPASIVPPKSWPLSNGALTCLTCHEQGHEDQTPRPFLLRDGPYASRRDVCARCHSGFDLLASTLHRDINEGRRCDFCHSGPTPVPGRDTARTITLIADPELLCLRCHDLSAGPENTTSHHDYLGQETLRAEQVPEFLPLYKGRVSCSTCHNPHMLEAGGFRLRQGLAASSLCGGCHRQ